MPSNTERRVALATCSQWPNLNEDDALLVPALADLGIEAVPVVWDNPQIDWSAFDAVVLRETWDYAERIQEFLDWAKAVTEVTHLINSLPAIHWSTDKHYLHDLAAAEVPVVPTSFIEPGGNREWELPDSEEFVIKPAVSAGSRNTERYPKSDRTRADAHVQRLLAEGRSVMVQPYLASVDTVAETALLYFGGVFSHAARKGPLLLQAGSRELTGGLFLQETIDPRTPSEAYLLVGAAAMAVVEHHAGEVPVYARVDLIEDDSGNPVVLEVELVEPSTFLPTSQGAADRFAEGIRARLDGLR